MKPIRLSLAALGLALVCLGCASVVERPTNVLFQASTINALLEGVYDGEVTCGELKRHGDLGIGTFDALDGEMVVVDGEVYQIKVDGLAYPVEDRVGTPFASVVFFEADDKRVLSTDEMSLAQIQRRLDEVLPSENLFYAIRIDGVFSHVKTRSVPRQNKPYPPLADAIKKQAVYEFRDVPGVIVGFRCPKLVEGVNVPGYHFHFITSDRRAGGHLLECAVQYARVQIDYIPGFHLSLPTRGDFLGLDLTGAREAELKKVER